MARWIVLAGVLAGCGGGAAVPADCSTVSLGVHKYWNDRAAVATDPDEKAAIAESEREAAERFERHCRNDRWSDEMIACARTVFRLDDSGCLKYLSQGQRVKLTQEGEPAPIPGGMGIGR